MKTTVTFLSVFVIFTLLTSSAMAQNTFPATGRAGIYTTAPAASLQVKGGARIGSLANYAAVDSATGNLSFSGSSGYLVANNKFAFAAAGSPLAGLYFNATNLRYEFRNTAGTSVFNIGANAAGNVGIGVLVPTYKLEVAGDASFNGVRVGRGNGAIAYNTAIGASALFSNTTGTYNTANGYLALGLNLTGSSNTASGLQALYSNTSGSNNIAIGAFSLNTSTSGFNNTALGFATLYANTTGYSNVAVGASALYKNTNQSNLVAVGDSALYSNTTGNQNTANGSKALYSNTTGSNNTANGYQAGFSNTTGASITANGYKALYSNSTGNYNTANGSAALFYNTTGSINTANGYNALNANTTGSSNTALGVQTLQSNTTGSSNTGVGANALVSNTTGNNNTANGINTLISNSTGYSNVAVGVSALYKNTNQSNLVAVGDSALFSNTTGIQNTANGSKALYFNTTGSFNTANGTSALFYNTTGYGNTANGDNALISNTTGNQNTANGSKALYLNTTGSSNTANGTSALFYNTTGYGNTANGANALITNTTGFTNTAIGFVTLQNNTTGFANTSVGANSLVSNTTGNTNTANGSNALIFNTTGSNNTGTGSASLMTNTTGDANTGVGVNADVLTAGLTNATAIGYIAIVDASNKVRIGNTGVASIGGQVGWTTFSDGRYKKNIKENVKGLTFINSLKPVTYTVDINGLNTYFDKGRKQDSIYEKSKKERQPAADEASKIVYNGFIAQDVEAAAKKLNYNFSGVDKPKTEGGLYGLRYSDFVVPLVKAVQELSQGNVALQTENEDLKTTVDKLQSQMTVVLKKLDELQNAQQACCNNLSVTSSIENKQSVTLLSGASLDQNIPNPFTNTTAVNYILPQSRQGGTTAQIVITDKNGKTIKSVNISGSGKGTLQVDASTLASGAYSYSLYVDGKMLDSKMMVKQ